MKNKPVTIKTARLTLRSITEEDWQDMRALLYDERIKKTYMIPDFPTEETAAAVPSVSGSVPEAWAFCVRRGSAGRLVGFVNDAQVRPPSRWAT